MSAYERKLTGLIAAPYTPMRPDGSLALDTIDALAERLVADGVNGAFPCGTTGEFSSLTADERRSVCRRWVDAAAGTDLAIVAHVGGTSIAECRALAESAQSVGADAIACIAPYFFTPASTSDLVEFCAGVAAGAPELPFYFYHLPALSGVHLSVVEFLERSASVIPNLAGVKFSDTDLMELARCVALEGGRYNILFGCDEILLSGLAFGCDGAVGTTYAFAAPLYLRLLDAFAAGDWSTARELQLQSMSFIDVFLRYGGHRAMKAAMKLTGIDCGPVRRPLRPLERDEYDAMAKELERIGFSGVREPDETTAV